MTRSVLLIVVPLAAILGGAAPSATQIGFLRPAALTPGQKLFQAGVSALERNDLAAAEAAFRESLTLDGEAAAPYVGLAEVALGRGQSDTAERHLGKAVSLARNSGSNQTLWRAYLYANRELPAAEAAFRKPVGTNPDIMEAHLHLGDLYLTAFGKTDEAIGEYQTAMSLAPEHAGVRYALGLALVSKGSASEGETQLLKASQLAPDNPLPLRALGGLYSTQRQYDKALAALDGALKIHPAFPAAHYERGQIFAAKGDDASAVKAYVEAQKHDPKHSIGYMAIGMVYQRNQRWANAQLAYLAAVALEPSNADAYNNLAWMAAERRANLAQALAWARKATSLAPKSPEFQVTLGWVYRAQGDLAMAEQTLRTAVSLDTKRAMTLYYLGRVYLERRKTTEGIAELKKALTLQPDFQGADDARALLNRARGR